MGEFKPFDRHKILKLYRVTAGFYLVPIALLILQIIDSILVGTGITFIFFSILSLPICSLIGISLSIAGTQKANKIKAIQTADSGIALFYLGLFLLVIGLIGSACIYVILYS